MVDRTLQNRNGSYYITIPAALIDILGLKKGDLVSFGIEEKKITMQHKE